MAETQDTSTENKPAGSARVKKICQLSLQEVQKEISATRQSMGGLHSRYGRALVAREQVLKNEAGSKKK